MINVAQKSTLAIFLAGVFLSQNLQAQSITLDFPVDCELGTDCFIQNYVDRDRTEQHSDFGCGHLSYDGHLGTDIALVSEAEIGRDVAVFATAPGRVRATRDGMPDINIRALDAPDVSGRSCGNAVVITHEDGWETRYCHLKQGSVAVRRGDTINAGTRLGSIGLSGRTEFPHLHLTVVKDGETVDPFQPTGATNCGGTDNALWRDDIVYTSAGFISAGASPELPEFANIKLGIADHPNLPRDAAALVIWAQFFGPRRGDVVAFNVIAPDGSIFQETNVRLERNQARAFRAVGRKLTTSAWPLGRYRAEIDLIRNGRVIDSTVTAVDVR